MSEKTFQKKIIDKYTKADWFVLKLMQTNKNGIPDVLCLKSGHPARFIEVKGSGGTVSDLQTYRIKELKGFKFDAGVMFEGKHEIIIPGDEVIKERKRAFLMDFLDRVETEAFSNYDDEYIINEYLNN